MLKAFAVYQIFDEPILGHKDAQITIRPTKEEAEKWISERQRVQCYSQDVYETREVTIERGDCN